MQEKRKKKKEKAVLYILESLELHPALGSWLLDLALVEPLHCLRSLVPELSYIYSTELPTHTSIVYMLKYTD